MPSLLLRQAKDATMKRRKLRATLWFRNIIWRMSPVELRQPLIDDLDNLARVPIVKMIPSIDELID